MIIAIVDATPRNKAVINGWVQNVVFFKAFMAKYFNSNNYYIFNEFWFFCFIFCKFFQFARMYKPLLCLVLCPYHLIP